MVDRYDDGRWYIVTLGHFIGLLVDAGHDPAVRFRVIDDEIPDETGGFIRRMEIALVPDGRVMAEAKKSDRIHKVLQELLDAGLVS